MQEIIDQFLWTRDNKVITRDIHHVPGLANFSHWNFRAATVPAKVHYHTNIFEIHCMIRGRRVFQVLREDGEYESFTVSGKQAAITFPQQAHGYRDSFLEPYEFYSFQLDVSDPGNMLGLDPVYSRSLCSIMQVIMDEMKEKGEQRLMVGHTHIILLRTAFNFFSSLQEEGIRMGVQFLSCFCFSLKYLTLVTDSSSIDAHIQTAIEYMRANYMEKPSLLEISEKAGYSLSYFKAKFKEETGITPADYLSILRLEYAKDQLANTDESITSISSELNFSSASHFCSAFKKRTSYTPREYRQKKQS